MPAIASVDKHGELIADSAVLYARLYTMYTIWMQLQEKCQELTEQQKSGVANSTSNQLPVTAS